MKTFLEFYNMHEDEDEFEVKQIVIGGELTTSNSKLLDKVERLFNSIRGLAPTVEYETFKSPAWTQVTIDMNIEDYNKNKKAVERIVSDYERKSFTVTTETLTY